MYSKYFDGRLIFSTMLLRYVIIQIQGIYFNFSRNIEILLQNSMRDLIDNKKEEDGV